MSSDLKQIGGAALTIAGAAVGGWWAIPLVAGGVYLQREGAKDAAEEAKRRARGERSSRSIKGNVRGSSESHYVCFGRVRAGGIVCAIGPPAASTPGVLHIGIAHSLAHPGGCEDIAGIWINDEFIHESEISGDPLTEDAYVNTDKFVSGSTRMVNFRHYRGTSTQTADSTLTAANALGGSSAAYRRGIAWTRFTLRRPPDDPEGFEAAFKFGIPTLSVELKANRCYDPRSDSTNGGNGGQRYDDATTWAWSQNPAVIAATYMIMETSDGGMGYDPAKIDWPSVAAAANICDEIVTNDNGSPTVSQARYQCNVALDTTDSRETNLQKILDSMMGVRVRVGDKYKIYAGAYSSPEFEFDASYLRGPLKITTRDPLEKLYNAVRITHDDEEQNFRTVEAPPFTSAAYEAQDGGERMWREEARQAITNTYQAQYVGTVLGQMSREQKIIEAPCNFKALNLEVWQVGKITLDELGLDADTYRLIGFDWEANGPRLTFREETEDVWIVNSYRAASITATPDLVADTPTTPTGFAATASADGVRLTWNAPSPPDAPFVEIWRASGTGSPQVFAQIGTSSGFAYTDEPSDSTTYHYKARRRNRAGTATSDFTPEVTAVTGSVKVVASGAQLGDARNANTLLGMNRQPAVEITGASPLTGQDIGSVARINIAAHDIQTGFGTVSYSAGSVSNLAFETLYYVYADDPTQAGGAVTYSATTTFYNVQADNDRYYVGFVTTPANGSPNTNGGGGPGFEP